MIIKLGDQLSKKTLTIVNERARHYEGPGYKQAESVPSQFVSMLPNPHNVTSELNGCSLWAKRVILSVSLLAALGAGYLGLTMNGGNNTDTSQIIPPTGTIVPIHTPEATTTPTILEP